MPGQPVCEPQGPQLHSLHADVNGAHAEIVYGKQDCVRFKLHGTAESKQFVLTHMRLGPLARGTSVQVGAHKRSGMHGGVAHMSPRSIPLTAASTVNAVSGLQHLQRNDSSSTE